LERKQLKKLAVNINRNHGDALQGEKVIAQAREVSKCIVVPGTASHRIQEVSLRSNVLCVIDRAFVLKEREMRIKSEN
jgi:hypothetical protein